MAGNMGNRITDPADTTPLGPKGEVHPQTISKSRIYNDTISKLKVHKKERRFVSDISYMKRTETK